MKRVIMMMLLFKLKMYARDQHVCVVKGPTVFARVFGSGVFVGSRRRIRAGSNISWNGGMLSVHVEDGNMFVL